MKSEYGNITRHLLPAINVEDGRATRERDECANRTHVRIIFLLDAVGLQDHPTIL